LNIVVIGMGYPSTEFTVSVSWKDLAELLRAGSGIPCAVLLADMGWRLAFM